MSESYTRPRLSRNVLRPRAVAAKLDVCIDTVYRMVRAGKLPKPLKLSERASAWFEDEIDAYLAQRAAERDATPRSKTSAAAPGEAP